MKNLMNRKKILCLALLALVVSVKAQQARNTSEVKKDTLVLDKSDRNVMLNASDASAPREIPIGLPSTFVNVYENGMPAVYSSVLYNVSSNWRNESSLVSLGLMDPVKSAISTGNVAYSVTSFSQLGSQTPKSVINYSANHFGLQQFDVNTVGAMSKNWLYSLSMYQIFDPGTQKWTFTDFYDRTQMYKGVLTRLFAEGRGRISFVYKFVKARKATNMDSQGPFMYVGDGSIKEVNGFHLGTSSYVSGNGEIQYMDLLTGRVYKDNFRNDNYNKGNDYSILSEYNFKNGMKFTFNTRYLRANTREVARGFSSITTINNGVESGGTNTNIYYDQNGNLYSGEKQLAIAYQHISDIDNFFVTSELAKKSGSHSWKLGVNEWLYKVNYHSNSTMCDITVEPNPSYITHTTSSGESIQYFNYNVAGSEYHVGHENRTAVYLEDEWKPLPALTLNYGGRLEYYNVAGDNLPYERFDGFYVGATTSDGKTVSPQHFSRKNLNHALSLQAEYNVTDHFGVTGDATLTTLHPTIDNYASFSNPKDEGVNVNLFRGGVFFKNKWINLTSMITQIKKSNFYTLINVSNPSNNTESKTTAFNYNIQTLGWTTSAELDPFKGFHLHLLATVQQPKYDNYETTLTFNGTAYSVSASGKTVIGISKILFEIDPSYTFLNDNLKVWASLRYFGKQYANLSNALYFNGHWETFAGADYKMSKKFSLSGSVINFLNQRGATGTIAGAELITKEQASKFNNTMMTGYFLRPFAVQVGAKYQF